MPPSPIVVVTDDARLRDEIVGSLPAEFAVHLAADSRVASELMRSITPALVLAEIRTGSAGGVGLARDMAQDSRLANVPVLMLLERPQDEWLARAAGARLVRTRPISIDRLVIDIRDLTSATTVS